MDGIKDDLIPKINIFQLTRELARYELVKTSICQ